MPPITPTSSRQLTAVQAQSSRLLTRSAPSLTSTSGVTTTASSDLETPTRARATGPGLMNSSNGTGDTLFFHLNNDIGPFVQHSNATESDDPFIATEPTAEKAETTTHEVSNAAPLNGRTAAATPIVSGPGSAQGIARAAQVSRAMPGLQNGTARSIHRQVHATTQSIIRRAPLRAANSQHIPSDPTLCVFVGNLPNSVTDDHLTALIYECFVRFGPNFVTISHDNRGFSTAFVQYATMDAVLMAIDHGSECAILGRQCRVERALVRRTLSFLRRDSHPVNPQVVQQLCTTYGPVNWVFTPRPSVCQTWGLISGAVYIQFHQHSHCQAALSRLRVSREYIVDLTEIDVRLIDSLPTLEWMGAKYLCSAALVSPPEGPPTTLAGVQGRSITPQEHVRLGCWLLVENLVPPINYSELTYRFSCFGRIVHVEYSVFMHAPGHNFDPIAGITHHMAEWALINYDYLQSAITAMHAMHGYYLNGHFIVVSQLNDPTTENGREARRSITGYLPPRAPRAPRA